MIFVGDAAFFAGIGNAAETWFYQHFAAKLPRVSAREK